MKAVCASACEIAGVGIVQAGEEVELPDGFYNDQRIRTHFHIVEASVRDRGAKPPDMMAEADARRERFAKSLADHAARIAAMNRLVDFGAEIPRELLERTPHAVAAAAQERIAKIVQLWCDNFGYDFPTDGKRPQGGDEPAKKPGRGKRGKPPEGEEEAPPEGEKAEAEAEGEPGGKGEGEGADDAQQSLFDRLNGNP